MKPVTPRARARLDVAEAIERYEEEAGAPVALRFITAVERAYAHLGRHPASGSARYADALGLPDLRSWPVPRFPYVIFYVEQPGHVDVWRVLHGHRDLPPWLGLP